jgi:hypothetical protein
MIIMVFVTQEILGAGRFLPVPEEEITTTLAEVFLRGVCGDRARADRADGGGEARGGPAEDGGES